MIRNTALWALSAALLLGACKKDNPVSPYPANTGTNDFITPNTFVLNGDGHENEEFSWDSKVGGAGYNEGYYSFGDEAFHIFKISNANAARQYAEAEITAASNDKANLFFSDRNTVQFQFYTPGSGSKKVYNSVPGAGNIYLTQVDKPGGLLQLNFSGTFENADTHERLTIKAGALTATRLEDK